MKYKYFIGDEAEYMSDVFNNDIAQIHEFNYMYISYYLQQHKLGSWNNNIINDINNNIDLRFENAYKSANYDTLCYYYGLLTYVLKNEVKFEIQNWIETRFFINVIKFKFLDFINSSSQLLPIVREMLEELIDIIYGYDVDAVDTVKDRILFNFDLLEKELGDDHYVSSVKLHEDVLIDHIKQKALEKYFKNELKLGHEDNEPVKDNSNSLSSDLNIENIPNIDIYKGIKKLLAPFIERGTFQNYRTIIHDKKFSSKKTYLTLIDLNKKEAILFAKTFNLDKEQLISVLKLKNGGKTQVLEISDAYFKPTNFNKLDPSKFECELVKVRNEYLNKINPKEFPLIASK